MSLSSIFSFNTLSLDRKPDLRSVIGLCALILSAELFLFFLVAFNLIALERHNRWVLPPLPLKYRDAIGMDIDVLFVGDSQVLYGVNPETFEAEYKNITGREISSYNGALQGHNTELIHHVLDKFLNETRSPRWILYGLSPTMVNSNSLYMRNMTNWVLDPASINQRTARRKELKFNLWFYRDDINFFMFKFLKSSPMIRRDGHLDFLFHPWILNTSGHRGYEPHEGTVELKIPSQPDPRYDNYAAGGRFMEELEKTILLCKSRNIKLMIFPASSHHFSRMSFPHPGRNHSEYIEALRGIASKYDLEFWDPEGYCRFENTDFYDVNHLNAKGASKFSRMLGKMMADKI